MASGLLLVAPGLYGQASPGQVTTLAALTANNTSASSGINPPADGGAASVNVSKISIASVLPVGSNVPIYAHVMAWFGSSTHMDVGYSSSDSIQVQKQVADMLSRGFKGAIINWHGAGDITDQAALLFMAEAETRNGAFQFAIEDDAQTLVQCAATRGCDLTAKVVADLTYVQQAYLSAAPYMSFQGHPLIFLYGMEAYAVNWSTVQNALGGKPVFVFRSAAGAG